MRCRVSIGVLLALAVVGGCTREPEAAPSTSGAPSTTPSTTPTTTPGSTATTAVPTTPAPTTAGSTSTSTIVTTTTPVTTTTTTTVPATTTTRPATTTTVAPTTTRPATTTTSVATAPAVALWQGTSGRHEVALTFDAGSDTGFAAQILDLLADEGIVASFGMSGAWATANPDLVARMVAEGHVLINHTQTHPYMTELSTDQRLAELAAADAAVAAITGRTMAPFFRPPFGDQDDSVLADIARAGYRWSVMWTVDSLGWKGLTPDAVADRVLAAADDGAIVLMHVGSQSTDAAALPAIIAGLRADGYGFVTVARLVA
jgi:peptidoglycan/xylan/chitin deacetylase (PgdA/CDA1 family)